MPRVTQAHQRRQRRRILDQATEVFAEHGYGLATVDEICRGAGLSKGALYSYFSSKEELFVATAQEIFERRYASVAVPVSPEPPGKGGPPAPEGAARRIEDIVDGLASHLEAEDRAFARLWVEGYLRSDKLPALEKLKTDYRLKFRELIVSVLREGQDDGEVDARLDVTLLADTVMALVDGLMLHSLVPGWEVDFRRVIDGFNALVIGSAGEGASGGC